MPPKIGPVKHTARKTYALKPKPASRSDAAQGNARTPHVTPHPTPRKATRSDAAQRTTVSRSHPETINRRKIARDAGAYAHVLAYLVDDLATKPHSRHTGRAGVHGETDIGIHRRSTMATALGAIPIVGGGAKISLLNPIAKRGAAVAAASLHDPIGVQLKTAKGAVEMVKAIPSGVVNSVLHPEATGKALVKDYGHRYGEDFDEMVKEIRKEGAAPEVADALAVATLGGGTIGRAAVSAAAKGGSKFATAARPALRLSGGLVKDQELAGTPARLVTQRVHDALRTRKTDKVRRKLEDPNQRGVDAVAAEAARTGTVVRLRPLKVDRTLAKSVAKLKSHGVHRMKSEQHRLVDGARKVLKGLNKHERRAFYYVATGQAPAERAGFEAALGKRVQAIKSARSEHGEPEGLTRLTDELRSIPKIDTAKIDFTKLRAVHNELRPDALRVGREDPALNAGQRLERRYAQQADALGIRRGEVGDLYEQESTSAFVKRVQKAAADAGHERPIYFPSERFSLDLHPDHASRAVGGARAVAEPSRYKGTNYRLGIQDTSPETYLTGMARNIKRKHNWKLVADLADDHAIGGIRGTASAVRQEMYDRGAHPGSYQLWNPAIFRGEMSKAMHELDDPSADALEAEDFAAHKALAESKRADDEHYARRGGWVAIPKQAFKEIEDSTKPSGLGGRAWDIFKGKNSRILLGAGNIPWLQFQVASNALLGLGATRLMLGTELPKAIAWWRGLDTDAKEEIDSLLGTGANHDVQQVHLGATTNSRIVAGYRALRDHPLWSHSAKYGPALRQLNPIEAMFKADHAQTAWFKRAVLYNRVKRDAWQRMGRNAGAAHRLQDRIAHALTLGPEDAMRAVLKDKAAIERHAATVNDWLGDYVTYTARERKLLSRSVMFYGFLRFSLKFAFYTMPVKHPGQTAIIAKLGQLQAQEIKDLLGGKALPWSFGKLYLTKDGKLQEIDLTRANPALNMVAETATGRPSSWVGVAPPVLLSLAEQLPGIGARRFYYDRPWYVEGHGFGSRIGDYTLEQRGRILGEQLLDLAAPYRIAEDLTLHGTQGDDSMLFDPRPTVNRGARRYDKAKRRKLHYDSDFDAEHNTLLNALVPMLPRPSRDVTDAELQQPIETLRPRVSGASRHHRRVGYGLVGGRRGAGSSRYGIVP
jgi:hypothetical protein